MPGNRADWYYHAKGQTHGPVTARDVVELHQAGDLSDADLVWRPGLDAWQSISEQPGLLTPPPPPPSTVHGAANDGSSTTAAKTYDEPPPYEPDDGPNDDHAAVKAARLIGNADLRSHLDGPAAKADAKPQNSMGLIAYTLVGGLSLAVGYLVFPVLHRAMLPVAPTKENVASLKEAGRKGFLLTCPTAVLSANPAMAQNTAREYCGCLINAYHDRMTAEEIIKFRLALPDHVLKVRGSIRQKCLDQVSSPEHASVRQTAGVNEEPDDSAPQFYLDGRCKNWSHAQMYGYMDDCYRRDRLYGSVGKKTAEPSASVSGKQRVPVQEPVAEPPTADDIKIRMLELSGTSTLLEPRTEHDSALLKDFSKLFQEQNRQKAEHRVPNPARQKPAGSRSDKPVKAKQTPRAQWRRIQIRPWFSIELPTTWVVRSKAFAEKLSEWARLHRMNDKIVKRSFMADTALERKASMNVRFYPKNTIGQKHASKLCDDDLSVFNASMKKAMSSNSQFEVLDWKGTTCEAINDLKFIVTEYVRGPVPLDPPTTRRIVRLFRLLNDAKSLTITVSYDATIEASARPVTDHIARSFRLGSAQ